MLIKGTTFVLLTFPFPVQELKHTDVPFLQVQFALGIV